MKVNINIEINPEKAWLEKRFDISYLNVNSIISKLFLAYKNMFLVNEITKVSETLAPNIGWQLISGACGYSCHITSNRNCP